MTDTTSPKSLAQIAYDGYAASTNGLTHDGRPMLSWVELPQRIQAAWAAAVVAVFYDAGNGAAPLDGILQERLRQVTKEGWTAEHDDTHTGGELAVAAAAYAIAGTTCNTAADSNALAIAVFPEGWDPSWFKPTDRRRNLEKAGALLLAELERLNRAAGRS